MQVTRATFIPLLAPGNADRIGPAAVRDEYTGDLTVVYTFGPQFGRRVVTHADLEQLEMPLHALRRSAHEHLEVLAGRAEFHGQPPALMLSFEGLESSLLLANDFWTRLQGAVPGELVVGVPARDVVVVTGSQSTAGLEKARRCVERVFFAGDENLLTRSLLVRRGNGWEPFDRPAGARSAPRSHAPLRHRGPDQMPRQYQEHVSWPGGERVPVRPVSALPAARMPGIPVGPGPNGPVPLGSVSSGPIGAGPARGPQHSVAQHSAAQHSAAQHSAPPRGPQHTGSMPPVGRGGLPPASTTGTGSLPPMPSQRDDYQRFDRPADIAQFSAVPYSALPYSAAPYSALPYTSAPAPHSAIPYSAVPSSPGAPSAYLHSRGARGSQSTHNSAAPTKPRYRDDAYSTGARPLYSYEPTERPSHRDEPPARRPERTSHRDESYRGESQREDRSYREPVDDRYSDRRRDEPVDYRRPSYPDTWGTAPERTERPEWRTGPRARFSR